MLKELIDKFYIDQQECRIQDHFYISDAGKCPRAVFFKFKSAPCVDLTPRMLRIFEKGEYIHRNVVNVLTTMGVLVASEIEIPHSHLISGRADALLSIDNQLYVLDIKSINNRGFKALKKAKEDHVLQLQLYLHFFNIKKGMLLYVDKDQQELKEFIISYDKKKVKELLDGFKKLRDKIDKDSIPRRIDPKLKHAQCFFCSYKEICKTVGEKALKWDRFDKK
jgi:CRISPR-associated protein Cas4